MTLFPHHEADPGVVRGHATQAAQKAACLTTLGGNLSGRSSAAALEACGEIATPVGTVTAPPEGSSGELSGAAYFASGLLNRYAEAVDVFNVGIDGLNARYESEKAANFSLGVEMCTPGGSPEPIPPVDLEGAIREADAALQATLRQAHAALLAELDDEADAIAALLNAGLNDAAVTMMIAAGYLPQSALAAFPNIDLATLDRIRAYFHEARKMVKTPGRLHKLYAMFAAVKDVDQLAAKLATTEHQWSTLLRQFAASTQNPIASRLAGIDHVTSAQLSAHFRALGLAEHDFFTGLAAKANATNSWINAAKATGKIGGPLAALSVVSNAVDLGDLIMNGNPGKSGLDTALRATQNVTGLVSSGGGLLALTPALSLGPVGAGILIGAGLVSAGIFVYRNWDEISAGVQWAGDKVVQGAEWVGREAAERWDAAGENLANSWDTATEWADETRQDIGEAADEWADRTRQEVGEAAEEVGEAAEEIGEAAEQVGEAANKVWVAVTPW
ncbi:MAG: hypothetical protein ACRDO7_18465 [Nocardioidaceae bacterium]